MGTKTKEWEERSKTRAEELVALADTIKVLNDDDALDLFKKTLPGAGSSFVQTQTGLNLKSKRDKVVQAMRKVWATANAHHRPGLDFLVLALTGNRALNSGTFDKVIKMIDNMVAELKKEQKDDDGKLDYCRVSLDQADDKKKSLDKSVVEATEQRKAENEEFKSLMASDAAAKDLL